MAYKDQAVDDDGYSSTARKVLVLGGDGSNYADSSNGLPVEIVGASGDINVDSTSIDTSGYIGKASGTNADFTTAYTSATTITLSDLPSGIEEFKADDIVSLVQIAADGSVTNTYTRDDATMTMSSNVLTVAGATFESDDTFVVYTNVAAPSSGGSGTSTASGYIGKSSGANDFTVNYGSATTLTLGNYPDGSILNTNDIVSISVYDNTGELVQKLTRENLVLVMSGSTLTVTGFTDDFVSTNQFIIETNVARDYALDKGLDVNKIIEQSPLYDHYTDAVEIVSEQDLTAAYADFGGEIDTRTYTKIGVWVIADCNSSEDVDLKVLGKHESVGTDEYEIDGVSVKTLWSGSGTDFKKYYEFEVGGVPYIQLQAIAGTVGATAGDLTISITKVY